MFNPALLTPVRHEARFEHADSDEPPRAEGHNHCLDHALLTGEMRVLTGLPPVLAQGMFCTPMAFPLLMKLSTLQDEALHNTLAMAIKVLGAEGTRLPGSEGEVTQNFMLVDRPPSLAASTGKVGLQKVISAIAQVTHGGTVKSDPTHGGVHILGETFHTPSALLHGPYMARLSVVPISPGLLLLKQASLDLQGRPEGLREAVVDFFATHSAEWELRIQLCTDVHAMPIEDDAVAWPEERSPVLPLARITVPPQTAWDEARAAMVARHTFSPWHGLAAHRPLGARMRALRPIPSAANPPEPRSLDELAG